MLPFNVYTYLWASINCLQTWLGVALNVEIWLLISKFVFHHLLKAFYFLPHFPLPLPIHWFYFPDLRMALVTRKPMTLSGRRRWDGRKCRCFLLQLACSPWEWVPVLLSSMQIFSWNPMENNDTAHSRKGAIHMRSRKKIIWFTFQKSYILVIY